MTGQQLGLTCFLVAVVIAALMYFTIKEKDPKRTPGKIGLETAQWLFIVFELWIILILEVVRGSMP